MINIDFVNINNAKLIGRLLPWWIRGRRISLFLQALLYPIKSAHDTFKKWGLERYIESHITAQKASLEWYLKYKLKHHFRNEHDEFFIAQGINELMCCFSGTYWRNGLHWDNGLRWNTGDDFIAGLNMHLSCFNTGIWEEKLYWNNAMLWENKPNGKQYDDEYLETRDVINVYAPAIVETINYSFEDYERDIRNIMAKFMINFNKINIIIATNK